MKARFFCWAAAVMFFLIIGGEIIFSGVKVDNNIIDLLPHTLKNPAIEKANQVFSNSVGQKLIFLIKNSNEKIAEQAADHFYQMLKKNHSFKRIDYKISESEQQAWIAFYFPYRFSLLTSRQQALLKANNSKEIQQQALFNLYSPMSVSNSSLLEQDPYFLFQSYITSLPRPASRAVLSNGRLVVYNKNQWYFMIAGTLEENSFSLNEQTKIVQMLQSAEASTIKQYPHTHLLKSGMLFYANAGAQSARHDISIIGFGSLLGIILLMLFTFRSLAPLFFTLLSTATGFLAAFVVTYLLFGTVDLFTLLFGTSLIGISVDYAFFYYAEQLLGGANWKSEQGLKNIFPGISLGLFNIVVAYLTLSLTPFPGLRQLAVFSATGLIMSYATVVCLFPLILKPKTNLFMPALLKLSNFYLIFWQKISLKKIILLYLMLITFFIVNISHIKANDDVHVLESMPVELVNMEKEIRNVLGSHIGSHFYLIEGYSPEDVLVNEKKLIQAINQAFPGVNNSFSVNSYVPTIKEQKENFALIKTKLINKNLVSYLEKIGLEQEKSQLIFKKLSAIPFKPLTIHAWIQSPVSKSLRFLWLGEINNQYASVVLLSEQLNSKKLKELSQNYTFASYVNQADQISKTFKIYREKISYLLACFYIILFCFLILRYSFKKALIYILPPIGGSLVSLAFLAWFGIPLTLFNVLALVLVLGIGIDYVLFFAETKSNYQSTMLAVSLSAITMLLSFGLLTLSQTPVVHYFGSTVLLGILTTFILAPLAIRAPVNKIL